MAVRLSSTRALIALAAVAVLAAAPAALAQGAPPLAPGVQPARDITPTTTRYVVTNGTAVYRAPGYFPDQTTGLELKRGEHPQILGAADMDLYLLVGRDGKGVGYVPRSLLCPQTVCRDVKG